MRLFVWTRLAVAFILASWLAVTAARAGGVLVLQHDELTRKLRTEVSSGAITYADGRVVIRGHVKRVGGLVNIPFRIVTYFSRDGARVRLRAEELWAAGSRRDGDLPRADEKLAPLVNEETKADRVEIRRGGKAVFSQPLE